MKLTKITQATVTLSLTFANGTTKEYCYDLDDKEEGRPITVQLDTEVDVDDVTDYVVDTYRRCEAGDRRSVSLQIGGRGQNLKRESKPAPVEGGEGQSNG